MAYFVLALRRLSLTVQEQQWLYKHLVDLGEMQQLSFVQVFGSKLDLDLVISLCFELSL